DPARPATYLLSLHDALPIFPGLCSCPGRRSTQQVRHAAALFLELGQGLVDGLAAEVVDREVADHRVLAVLGGHGEAEDHAFRDRSEEHTSELQSRENLVCRL